MAPGAHVIVSDKHRFVFVGVPKAATQSLFPWLADNFEGRQVGMHTRKLPAGTEGYLVWSVVRNPYVRAVSMWWSVTGQGPTSETYCTQAVAEKYGDAGLVSFLRWVLDSAENGYSPLPDVLPPLWLGPQTAWLAEAKPKEVYRLESFGPHLLAQFVGKGKTLPPLPRNNDRQAEHGPWRNYMTPETVRLVNVWAANDFGAFGYEKRDP